MHMESSTLASGLARKVGKWEDEIQVQAFQFSQPVGCKGKSKNWVLLGNTPRIKKPGAYRKSQMPKKED